MKRLFPVLIVLALTFTLGCDREDEQPEPAPDEAAQALDDETPEPSPGEEPSEIAQQLGGALYNIMASFASLPQLQCQCAYQEAGFASAEDCIAENTVSDEQLEEFRACLVGVVDDHEDPPPETIEDFVGCMDASIEAVEACMAELPEDQCSDEYMAGMQACFGSLNEANIECENAATEEVEAWMDKTSDDAQACMVDFGIADLLGM